MDTETKFWEVWVWFNGCRKDHCFAWGVGVRFWMVMNSCFEDLGGKNEIEESLEGGSTGMRRD